MKAAERGPVLLVEDDEAARASLGDLLRDEGFEVVEARDGKVALDYVLSPGPQPSIILADLHMPVMHGAALIEVLASYVRLAGIPVVIITADPEPLPNQPRSVVARYLKPPPPEDLLALVGKYAACKQSGAPGSVVDATKLPAEADN
jgi:CheY-like chemotaxis protein